MTEVKANMAFGLYRRGERFQVDVTDVHVQGLIKGGYVTLIKEADDAGPLDNPVDPAWADCLFSDDLAAGAVQEEEEVDGQGAPGPGESDPDRT